MTMPTVPTQCATRGLRITLNRPNSFNALTSEMLDEVCEPVEKRGKDDDVRVIVHTGAGRAFSWAQTKYAFNATTRAALDTASESESEGQAALFETADFAEGTAAFRETRLPRLQEEATG